jgi:hypothetical protein
MPSTPSTDPGVAGRWVRTVEDARRFVQEVGLCLIFNETERARLPALWDVVDAPDRRPGERVSLVWGLKNDLPMTYPDEVFYGKLRGGRAMLCTLDRLVELYRQQRVEVSTVSRDAQRLLRVIAARPITSRELRAEAGFEDRASAARFTRALQELQVGLLIARVDVEPDTWFLFDSAYPEIAGWAAVRGATTTTVASS